MRREVVDGLHFAHGGADDGCSVLFVHGAMDRGAAFLHVARRLPDLRWTVYDRRGYGKSVSGLVPTFSDHVADLVSILTRYTDPVVLVGHSIGATIALAATASQPDSVQSLVCFEPPLPWMDWWPLTDGDGKRIEEDGTKIAVERFMTRVVGADIWASLPRSTREQRFREGETFVSELVTSREAAPFWPSAISRPTIISRGEPTNDVRRKAAEWLVNEIDGAQLVLLDGSPHGAHTASPEEFSVLIRQAVALGE